MTRYSSINHISHVCLILCVYCHVSMHVHHKDVPMSSINVYISQGVTADLLQLSVHDSRRLLMLEGLSKAVHDNKFNQKVSNVFLTLGECFNVPFYISLSGFVLVD